MRAGDQVALSGMNHKICNRHGRHAVHQAHPALATIERYVGGKLGAQEQQIRVLHVLADHPNRRIVGEIRRDAHPVLAPIARHVNVRGEVVVAVPVEGCVGAVLVKPRGDDSRDPAFALEPGKVLG